MYSWPPVRVMIESLLKIAIRQVQVWGSNDGHTRGGEVSRAGAEMPTEGRVERVERSSRGTRKRWRRS